MIIQILIFFKLLLFYYLHILSLNNQVFEYIFTICIEVHHILFFLTFIDIYNQILIQITTF